MTIDKFIKYIALNIGYLLMCVNLYAQGESLPQNLVVNEYGEPVAGAVVVSEFGKNQYVTSNDGSCQITVDDGSSYVVVRAIGFLDYKIPVDEILSTQKITLNFDNHNMGGVVNMGYNSYSRESVTGAVSSVTGAELDKTPSNILSETLSGRLPGLTNVQNLSELTFFGYGNYTKTIRGISSRNGSSPLIIIDGVVCPTQYYEFISPKEIESVSVLKDASATAIYGMQGANGVIVITTKRGFNGEKKVEAYVDQSFQQMIKRPMFINSARYAQLRNEAGERDGLGTYSQFSQDEIDQFGAGDNIAYPNNDWYDMFIKDYVLRQRAGVNVSGGSKKFKYFSELNFVNQGEPLIVEDVADRKYDPTPHVNIFNFRSNMDVNFNQYVSGFMRLAGSVKREKQTGAGMNWDIYSNLLSLPPTMYGPLSPEIEDDPDQSNQVVTIVGVDNPAYGEINRSGYKEIIETNVIAQAGLSADLSFITKGLSVSGAMAYQAYLRNNTSTTQEYYKVIRENDYSVLDNFRKYGDDENTPLAYSKGSVYFYYLDLFGTVEYKRQFGDHSIDAAAHTYYLYQEKEATGSGSDVLPYKRQNAGVSVLYGFKDRYFVKGDLGYSGSEQFHPDNRFIATPSISAAWIASKENFFDVDFISLLKLRASYGLTANDQIGGSRFLYLDNIRSSGEEKERGNPDLSPEKIKKLNLGLDLGLLNMFTIGVDYFKDKVDNMLVNSSSTIPVYQGIPLGYYPKLNNGKMENKGYEISVGFNKQFSKELRAYATFNFMQAKNKVISINESPYSDDYAYPYRTEGYRYGQQWGYKIDYSNGNGMFNSEQELASSNLVYSMGIPRVGDFIYQDLNNDNTIDEKDLAPMGYAKIPEQEYTFNGGVNWKNWEMSFLFHGVRNASQFISGTGVYENESLGIFNDIHLNAWTPERYAAGEEISYPALSLLPSTNHVNNDFFLMDRSYLRLRNLEIAHTLPVNLSKKASKETIRIAVNIQNLFTIDNVQSKYIDPEIGQMNTFQPYRVYNLGVNINF
ncbi:SusC/RagA family TonB-linked outer membrane protein [Maribellus sp. YY47]|uniref:SusC/RagA family TonB-linked outer membrane protein n=1 Tax=Maribellus sp. YY47 TaxID=2929486 RepID=UPI002001ACAF|nr:SusC/RagA family TonB-linked outer membrane protein [Maribellus sp. YY47]MCK3683463.1 SusC/RagA family TonB-linked outer membrane protein [Maribellus sp. YY47]